VSGAAHYCRNGPFLSLTLYFYVDAYYTFGRIKSALRAASLSIQLIKARKIRVTRYTCVERGGKLLDLLTSLSHTILIHNLFRYYLSIS
jgi:hypothetical protein